MRVLLDPAPALAAAGASPHTGLLGVFFNGAFVASFLGFFFAQLAKVFTHHYVEGVWDTSRLVGSGGMPSSHTAAVVALTTSIGVLRGTSDALFAACCVFSLVVMYDASGVRLHAGKQASVLNMIIGELPPEHPVAATSTLLKDTLGHTPFQVLVGALLGLGVGYIVGVLYLL